MELLFGNHEVMRMEGQIDQVGSEEVFEAEQLVDRPVWTEYYLRLRRERREQSSRVRRLRDEQQQTRVDACSERGDVAPAPISLLRSVDDIAYADRQRRLARACVLAHQAAEWYEDQISIRKRMSHMDGCFPETLTEWLLENAHMALIVGASLFVHAGFGADMMREVVLASQKIPADAAEEPARSRLASLSSESSLISASLISTPAVGCRSSLGIGTLCENIEQQESSPVSPATPPRGFGVKRSGVIFPEDYFDAQINVGRRAGSGPGVNATILSPAEVVDVGRRAEGRRAESGLPAEVVDVGRRAESGLPAEVVDVGRRTESGLPAEVAEVGGRRAESGLVSGGVQVLTVPLAPAAKRNGDGVVGDTTPSGQTGSSLVEVEEDEARLLDLDEGGRRSSSPVGPTTCKTDQPKSPKNEIRNDNEVRFLLGGELVSSSSEVVVSVSSSEGATSSTVSGSSSEGAISTETAPASEDEPEGTTAPQGRSSSHWFLDKLAEDPSLFSLTSTVFGPVWNKKLRTQERSLSADEKLEKDLPARLERDLWLMLWARHFWTSDPQDSGASSEVGVGCDLVEDFLYAVNVARGFSGSKEPVARGDHFIQPILRIVVGHTPQYSGQIAGRCAARGTNYDYDSPIPVSQPSDRRSRILAKPLQPRLIDIDVGMTQHFVYNFGALYLHIVEADVEEGDKIRDNIKSPTTLGTSSLRRTPTTLGTSAPVVRMMSVRKSEAPALRTSIAYPRSPTYAVNVAAPLDWISALTTIASERTAGANAAPPHGRSGNLQDTTLRTAQRHMAVLENYMGSLVDDSYALPKRKEMLALAAARERDAVDDDDDVSDNWELIGHHPPQVQEHVSSLYKLAGGFNWVVAR